MPEHEYFEELSSLVAVGELAGAELAEWQSHLRECQRCRATYGEFVELAEGGDVRRVDADSIHFAHQEAPEAHRCSGLHSAGVLKKSAMRDARASQAAGDREHGNKEQSSGDHHEQTHKRAFACWPRHAPNGNLATRRRRRAPEWRGPTRATPCSASPL